VAIGFGAWSRDSDRCARFLSDAGAGSGDASSRWSWMHFESSLFKGRVTTWLRTFVRNIAIMFLHIGNIYIAHSGISYGKYLPDLVIRECARACVCVCVCVDTMSARGKDSRSIFNDVTCDQLLNTTGRVSEFTEIWTLKFDYLSRWG